MQSEFVQQRTLPSGARRRAVPQKPAGTRGARYSAITAFLPRDSRVQSVTERDRKRVESCSRARFSELLDRSISLQQLIEDSIRSVTKEQCQGFHKGVKDALASCLEERPLSMNSSSAEFSIRDRPLRFQCVEESADSQQRPTA